MKKRIKEAILFVAATALCIGGLVCGRIRANEVYAAEPKSIAAKSEDEFTFMGGLSLQDPENDLTMAMFRDSDRTPVVVIKKYGDKVFGEYETETATLKDGREYTKITVGGHTFGYHFSLEDEEEDSFLVDEDGTAYYADDLIECVAIRMLESVL
jgi:hypothetical protein